MKRLLITSAIIEIMTGITLLAVPARLAAILPGATLDAPAGLVMARLAGAALVSLAMACWLGSRDVQSPAARGIITAMLFFNLTAIVILLAARYGMGLTGIGLLPASAVHAALAVWCIACLRKSKGL